MNRAIWIALFCSALAFAGDGTLSDLWKRTPRPFCLNFWAKVAPGASRNQLPYSKLDPNAVIKNYMGLMRWRRAQPEGTPAQVIPVEFAGESLATLQTLRDHIYKEGMEIGEPGKEFLRRHDEILAKVETEKRIDQRDVMRATIEFLRAVDPSQPESPPMDEPRWTIAGFDNLLGRTDFMVLPTTRSMTVRELNELSAYGIFPVQVLAKSVRAEGRWMSPRTFFLHDLRHMVATNNRFADFSYDGFNDQTLPTRIAFYTRFKRLAAEQNPVVEECMHQIYFGMLHDVDPKLYSAQQFRGHLAMAGGSGTFRASIREDVAAAMPSARGSDIEQAVEIAFRRMAELSPPPPNQNPKSD